MNLRDDIFYIEKKYLIPGNKNPSDEDLKNRANELLERIEYLQDRVAAIAIPLGVMPKDAVKRDFRFD